MGMKIKYTKTGIRLPVLKRRRMCGFTLMELLVVVAVVGILAAVLLMGVGKLKERGNGVKCANNLRQIGVALASYVGDHDGALVPGSEPEPGKMWYNVLEPYMSDGPEIDPSSPNRPKWQQCPSKVFTKNPDRFSVGYGWNYYFFGLSFADGEYTKWLYGYGARMSTVQKPSQTIIIGDSMDMKKVTESFQNIYVYFAYDLFARRHGDRGNYLFLDGHVESQTPEYLRANDILFRRVKE